MTITRHNNHPMTMTTDNTTMNRRDFLELGGKGLATLGTASLAAPLLTAGCQTAGEAFTPLNETRPVHYPRLAGHKIQSPEHYGVEGCMTSIYFGSDTYLDWDLPRYLDVIGKTPSIVLMDSGATTVPYGIDFRTKYDMEALRKFGSIPSLSFEVKYRDAGKDRRVVENLLAGQFDDSIRSSARLLAESGKQQGGFFIRTMHEMNFRIWPWSMKRERFKRAWIHIWTIFENEGANEYATWIWNPLVVNRTVDNMHKYYPGDEYVDWIGLNGYRTGSRGSFSQMFKAPYISIRKTYPGKPVCIAETGTHLNPRWIQEAYNQIKSDFPGIKFVNWWSKSQDHGGKWMDSRFEANESVLKAHQAVQSDPYFLGKVPYRDLKV